MLSWIAAPGGASVHADLMQAQVPDATTLAKMRHSLERQGLGKACALRPELRARKGRDHGAGWLHGGCDLHLGPKASRRTRTMRATLKAHQSKKGKNWCIRYKAHIGVDAAGGLVHGVETIA